MGNHYIPFIFSLEPEFAKTQKLHTIIGGSIGLYNRYHPGFINKFIKEDEEKLAWADIVCYR